MSYWVKIFIKKNPTILKNIRTIFSIKYLLSGSYSSFFCDLAGKNFWAGTDWAPLPASPESPATFYPPVTTPIIVSDYFLVLSISAAQYGFLRANIDIAPQGK
jgi:hypothetical protein